MPGRRGGAYLGPMNLERRKSGSLDRIDDWALVAVAVVGVIFALKIIGWVIGTVLFAVKVAIVVAVVAFVWRLITHRKN